MVDAVDYDRLKDLPWRATVGPGVRCVYAIYTYNRRTFLMHHLILPPISVMETDHVNNDGLDNRRSNLRRATRQQNSWNNRPRSGKRFKGVQSNKAKTKFYARLSRKGESWREGPFDTEEEAARAYDRLAVAMFGDYAFLNFPEPARNGRVPGFDGSGKGLLPHEPQAPILAGDGIVEDLKDGA